MQRIAPKWLVHAFYIVSLFLSSATLRPVGAAPLPHRSYYAPSIGSYYIDAFGEDTHPTPLKNFQPYPCHSLDIHVIGVQPALEVHCSRNPRPSNDQELFDELSPLFPRAPAKEGGRTRKEPYIPPPTEDLGNGYYAIGTRIYSSFPANPAGPLRQPTASSAGPSAPPAAPAPGKREG